MAAPSSRRADRDPHPAARHPVARRAARHRAARHRAELRPPRARGARPRSRWGPATALLVAAGVLLGSGGTPLRLDARHGASAPAGGSASGRAGPLSVAARATPSVAAGPADRQLAAVSALLHRRAGALLARDLDGWMAGVAGTEGGAEAGAGAAAAVPAFADRQRQVFDRLGAVPLASWSYEVTGVGPALPAARAAALPARSWVAQVQLEWSLAGASDDVVRRQQSLTVVPSGTGRGWALADDADGTTLPDLWDLGPVTVQRAQRAVLVGTAPADELTRCAALADEAARRVDAVWGTGWPRSTVVEVPATQDQLARLLGEADSGSLDQIAAVTTGEVVGGTGATQGDHVVLNPGGFERLAPLGQQVVLTHELTHVATRASATRVVPLWLSEGFADWVAYSGSGLARQDIASDLLTRVRAAGPPADLPDAAAFDPAHADVGPAYSGAWWAVDLLARRSGPARVVTFYRAASGAGAAAGAAPGGGGGDDAAGGTGDDAAVDAALRQVLGTDRSGLVRDWRASLVDAARQGAS